MGPLSICFPENHNMYSPKALLYIVLIVQVYTALAASKMTEDPTHDAEGKSGLKSDDSFTIEAKGSKPQVKSEIDAQMNRRQVCTRFYAKTRLKDMIGQALEDRSHRL